MLRSNACLRPHSGCVRSSATPRAGDAIRVLNESRLGKQNAPRPAGHEAHVSTLTNRHTFCFRSVKWAFVCDPRAFFCKSRSSFIVTRTSHRVSSPARVDARSARPESGRPSTPQRIDSLGITGSPADGAPRRALRWGPLAGDDTVGKVVTCCDDRTHPTRAPKSKTPRGRRRATPRLVSSTR